MIHNHGGLAYSLEANVCAIGRDQTNAIVLNKPSISRQHAMLMRVPLEQGSYTYRLVDGNAKGILSKNGIFINGKRCSSEQLMNGDMITFGPDIRATYMIAPRSQVDLERYPEAKQIYSIKEEVLDARATTVVTDLEQTGFFL
ncbi:MAG: FHA domain-containing protein [Thermosynechococcaceae cyanobacterium]